jgi:hypothetical protein
LLQQFEHCPSPNEINDYFSTHRKKTDTLSSLESLWAIFQIMLNKLDGTDCCVLDGLDECDEISLDAFLGILRRWFRTSSGTVAAQRL